jgi:hypothetical protein
MIKTIIQKIKIYIEDRYKSAYICKSGIDYSLYLTIDEY